MKLSYGIRKNAPAKSHASLAKAAFTILIVAVFLLGSPVFAYADDPGDSYAPFEAATGSGSGAGSEEDTVPATPSAEEGAEPDPAEGGAGDSAATGSGSGGGSEDTVPATHSAEEGAGPDPAEGGAGDSAGLGSEQDAQQETEDTTNDYLVPEGSAYIEGEEDTIYYNTAEKNAIQQAVDAAITKAKNDAVIVVNNGTYVGGINISKPAETAGTGGGEGAPASLDSLKIVAADALTRGEDNTIEGYTAGSAGGVAVEGDINIDGINVLLAGLYLSLKDTIKAGNADNFTYYGTALDDYTEIELEAIADKVEIDTGAGNDDLDVSIRQKPSAVFTVGPEGFDDGQTPTDGTKALIKGAISDVIGGGDSRLEVDIDLGEGNDKLELGLINSTSFDLTESSDTSGYDGVKVNLDVSASDVTVKGGAGSDNITVSGGSKLGLATVFIGPLLNTVIEELASITDYGPTTINIEGEAGDDTITVDTTTAFSSYRGVKVSVDGGAGYDRLHLTGKLNEAGEISGNLDKIDMVALAEIALLGGSVSVSKLEKSLSIGAASIEAYTDNLENKVTVDVTPETTPETTFESFKNYKLNVPATYVDPASYVNTSGLNTFLTNLIIAGKNIVIGTINTPHINIVIKSQDSGLNAAGSVTIEGEVRGKNILIFAQNSDSHSFGIVKNDLNDDEGLKVEASFFDIVSDVIVSIAAGAKLIATQIVSVLASSVQTKPLVPTLEDITSKLGEEYTDAANINFVAVKVGSATISVLGEIAAAAVNFLAETIVKVSAMGDNLAAFGMPLAVGVVVAEAGIKTSGNSKIKAETGGISLTSKSDVRLTTSSRSGLLPFTLGVSAVVNDSYVDVGGSTSLEAKGDILLSAAGYTRVVTEATGPKTTTGGPTTEPAGSSGGFFAISVVIQNVHAAIKDNASARSTEGSIDLYSTAFEYVVNNATSNPDDGGNSFSLENLISKVTGILGSAKTPASEGSGGQKSTGALDRIIGKLNGSGTGVTDVVNDGTSGATGSTGTGGAGGTSSTQLVGALAVTYAQNHNAAYIDTTNYIEAYAKLLVRAVGMMVSRTLADGSPITRTSAGATGQPSAPKSITNVLKPGSTVGVVTFADMVNGSLSIDKTEDHKVGDVITITVHPTAGYKLETITKDGVELAAVDGVYRFTLEDSGDGTPKQVLLAATFAPKAYTVTVSNENATAGNADAASYADEGDTVEITVNAFEGYTVGEVVITYKNSSGETVTITGTDKGGGKFQFTMPAGDVTVVVQFAGVTKKLAAYATTSGTITVKKADGTLLFTSNSTDNTDLADVQVGEELTVEVNPAEGYRLAANGLKIGTTVIKPTAGVYKFKMPAGSSGVNQYISATFEQGTAQPQKGSSGTVALGTGLAVAVINYSNKAYINAASKIEAGDLDISAITTTLSSSAIARAGFAPADLGLAGALSVHIVAAENSATLNNSITLTGGSINIEAKAENSRFATIADAAGKAITTVKTQSTSTSTGTGGTTPSTGTTTPSGKPKEDSTGIGAAIAVNVIGIDVLATIADTASITAKDAVDLESFNITASFKGEEELMDRAGASGGKAVAPVLGVMVSGVYVEANTGNRPGDTLLKFKNDINVNASNTVSRRASADASATGPAAGVGGTFLVDILNDSARANLGRSVRGKNIGVAASSVSRLKAAGRAGANGASGPDNSGDSGSGDSGSGDGGSGDSGSGDPDPAGPEQGDIEEVFDGGEPDDEVSGEDLQRLFDEGEADAIAKANTDAAAQLSGAANTRNVNQNSIGSLAENRQPAQTSEGSVQAAATLVLNILSNNSYATIADGLTIISEGNIDVSSKNDTDAEIKADSSAVNSTTGVGVAVAINVVIYNNLASIGDSRINAGGNLRVSADIIDAETKEDIEAIVESILSELITRASGGAIESVEGLKSFVDDIVSFITGSATTLKDFVTQMAHGIDGITGEQITELTSAIVSRFTASLLGGTSEIEIPEQLQGVVSNIMELIAGAAGSIEVIKKLLTGETIKNVLNTIADPVERMKTITSAGKALALLFGSNDEQEGVGHMVSTQAISGVGASNVGVTGSAAIAVVKGTTEATVKGRAQLVAGDDIVAEDIVISANTAQKLYTTASASTDKSGKADKNKTATNNSGSTSNGGGTAGSSNAPGGSNSKTVGVGASFAIAISEVTVSAGIGDYRKVSAKSLSNTATAGNDLETISVAGTDPIARNQETGQSIKPKDIAVDASVAVSLIENEVKAFVGRETRVTTTGTDTIDTENEGEKVNLYIYAFQAGKTRTDASGFAMGGSSAVGAAAAVNIAISDVLASFVGKGTVAGNARVVARTFNQDDSNALALAMGADVDRYLSKFREAQAFLSKAPDQNTASNKTSNKISGELSDNSGASGGSDVSGSLPVSTNALHANNTSTASTKPDSGSAGDDLTGIINDASGSDGSGAAGGAVGDALGGKGADESAQKPQKVHVAAAVAVNVTVHSAVSQITGELSAKNIDARATNNGNFSTAASGVAASPASNTNSIGLGAAVSVNMNKAKVNLGGLIISRGTGETESAYNGDINAIADLTQNMDGVYRGRYGALAIAGSVSGSGGKVNIAGALAVVISLAETAVTLAEDSEIRGGDIVMSSADKSKLSAAAMAATLSGGTTVGVGASFALLFAQNKVLAIVGNDSKIYGKSFTLNAEKKPVDISDWGLPFEFDDILTQNETDNKGIINIGEDKDGNRAIEVNVEATDLVDLAQLTSFLASVNYYASAAAGSIVAGADSKLAMAGAVTVLLMTDETKASVGDGVEITLTGGGLNISAKSQTNARLIGGALNLSTSKIGIGLNVAIIYNNDKVSALVGESSIIVTDGLAKITAESKSNLWSVTAAASVTAGGASQASVGGAITAIVSGNVVNAFVGKHTAISARNGITIKALNNSDLVLISLAASIAGSKGMALGGLLSLTITNNIAKAGVGEYVQLTAENGGVEIQAVNQEMLISFLGTAAAATAETAAAGIISLLITNSEARATVGSHSIIDALNNTIIKADADSTLVTVQAAFSGSGSGAAVGATIGVNLFKRVIEAAVGEKVNLISRAGNVVIEALGKDWTVQLTMAAAASGSGTGIGGNLQIGVVLSEILASVGKNARIEAYDSIGVFASNDSNIVLAAAAAAISGGTGVCATIATSLIFNTIHTDIAEEAALIAYALPSGAGSGVKQPSRDERRSGVIIGAFGSELIVMATVGASVGGGSAAVGGVVSTLLAKNKVKATVRSGVNIRSGAREGETVFGVTLGAGQSSSGRGEIAVEADDSSIIIDFAGTLTIGSSAGVGVTVAVLVLDKEVKARVGSALLNAVNNITVSARADDNVFFVGATFGVSGSTAVSLGGNMLYFENDILAELGGKAISSTDIAIRAESDALLVVFALAFAGSGSVAVGGAGAGIYFTGSTIARILDGAEVSAAGKTDVEALSSEIVSPDALGIAGSGTAAVSGAVVIVITSLETKAYIGKYVTLKAGALNINAEDDYLLVGVAATAAGSGTAAVAVTAVVAVASNTVSAYISGLSDEELLSETADALRSHITTTSGDVSLRAKSNRDIKLYAGTVAIGGAAGVAATIMVAVVGGKLNQDSANELGKGFNAGEFENGMAAGSPDIAKGYSKKDGNLSLTKQLEGDGDLRSGDTVGSDGEFNGSDGYVDPDLDDEYDGDKKDSPGSDHTPDKKPGGDADNAANLGRTQPNYDPKDSTSAYIGSGAIIVSAGNIDVLAEDLLTTDIVTATIGGGLYAGVGAGLSVAVLFSNVLAYVENDAVLSAVGDISIKARGGSMAREDDASSDENKALSSAIGKTAEEILLYTIRAISVTGSGGFVGVSVAVSVVSLVSNIKAYLEGDVVKAASLSVHAEADYPYVIAATLGLSGGVVSVSASVASAAFSGKVFSAIVGNARIGMDSDPGNTVGAITVSSKGNIGALAIATALGAGGVAVNGAIALAVNLSRFETFIGQGVNLRSTSNVTVKSDVETGATAAILSISITGGVSANLSAAIAIISPTVLTYIGTTPGVKAGDETPGASSEVIGKVEAAGNIFVRNDIVTDATTAVITVAAGGLGMAGSVLLVFNDTSAYAGINKINITAAQIDIDGYMDSGAQSLLAAATAGSVAVGLSVSFVWLNSSNIAFIDLDGVLVVAPIINIYAGRQSSENSASATATAVSAAVGLLTVNVNAAIADNKAVNRALLYGAGAITAEGALNIGAYGRATATATIIGLDVGGATVTGSVAVALLRSEQSAEIRSGSVSAGTLNVKSYLNQTSEDSEKDTSKAIIITGGGALISGKVSIAIAYGRSKNIAKAAPASLTLTGSGNDLTIGSYGNAGTLADIKNASFGVIAAGVMLGFAYAQSTFQSILELAPEVTVNAGSITVETIYMSRAVVDLTPSAGGADVSAVSAKVNLAIAVNSSNAAAKILGGVITATSITVKSEGAAIARSLTNTPIVSIAAVSVAANIMLAKLAAVQTASIENSKVASLSTTVRSTLNNGENEGAYARLGGNAKPAGDSIVINAISAVVNSATALANATSKASVTGTDFLKNNGTAGDLEVISEGKSIALADIEEASASLGLFTIGLNVLTAKAEGTYEAALNIEGNTLELGSVSVSNTYTSNATARTTLSNLGVKASLVDIKAHAATAIVSTIAKACVTGAGTINANSLDVSATGLAQSVAGLRTATVSISGIEIAANVLTSTLSAEQSAYISGATLDIAGTINVSSTLNQGEAVGASATLGSVMGAKLSVSLVGITTSAATALANAASKAYLTGVVIANEIASLNVTSKGSSVAVASVEQGSSIGYISGGATVVTASANGTFEAYAKFAKGESKLTAISVLTDYSSLARASTAQGLIGLSAYGAEVNSANALVGTIAKAWLGGQPETQLVLTGAVSVKASGKALATAAVQDSLVSLSGVNATANQVSATLSAEQSAYIENIKLSSGEITVLSELNKGRGDGATATLRDSAISAGGVDITAHVATAAANAKNFAYIKGADITSTGLVSVKSDATSNAVANLTTGSSLNGVGVGITVMYAYAQGVFNAYILDSSIITPDNIEVLSVYSAKADSTAAQPKGGSLSFSLADISGNTAIATVSSKASAYITNSNLSSELGEIRVESKGTAIANAIVKGSTLSVSGVKIALSIAKASLSGEQAAYITGGSAFSKNGVFVLSEFNKGLANNKGAYASLTSSSGANLSLVSGKANIMFATSAAKNHAYISASAINTPGALSVRVDGTSNAVATYSEAAAGASLVAIGLLYAEANSNGDFAAYIDLQDALIEAGSVSVTNIYSASAEARSTQPGWGFSFSLASGEFNKAIASVGVNARAYIIGNHTGQDEFKGTIISTGNVTVSVSGTARTFADIAGAKISISGVNVAHNVAEARVSAEQQAYVSSSRIDTLGGLDISSSLTSTDNSATAGANGGVELSAASGDSTKTLALANVSNKAHIDGTSIINVSDLVNVGVLSDVKLLSKSRAPDVTVSAVAVTVVNVEVDFESNVAEAYIGGTALVNGKNVSISAEATSTGTAKAHQPNTSVSAVSGFSIKADAKVTKSLVKAYIAQGAKVKSTLDTAVNALSAIDLSAKSIHEGVDISLANVGNYLVNAYVKESSTLAEIRGSIEAGKDVLIGAKDQITLTSQTNANNAGAANVAASGAKARIDSQTAKVIIGNSAVIEAIGDIIISALSESTAKAEVGSNSVALGEFGKVTAEASIDRIAVVVIEDLASVVSRYGNINITAHADKGNITSNATMAGGGVVAAGDGPSATANMSTVVNINIGNGVTVTALFGNLNITATSDSDINAYAYRHMGALAGSNKSRATISILLEKVIITIGGSGAQTTLNSRNTTIEAFTNQSLAAQARSYTASAGSHTTAEATINLPASEENNRAEIIINNAFVGGIDTLNIYASANNVSVAARTYAEIVGFTGKVYATSKVGGSFLANVLAGANSHIAGQIINIRADASRISDSIVVREATAVANTVVEWVMKTFRVVVEVVEKAFSWIPFVGKLVKYIVKQVVKYVDRLVQVVLQSDAEAKKLGTVVSSGAVTLNGSIHLGGAAAGIYIDIRENGNVVFSGLDDRIKADDIKTIADIGHSKIYNEDIGRLNVSAAGGRISSSLATTIIYGNGFIPKVVINNYSDENLELGEVITNNGQTGSPELSVGSSFPFTFADEVPALTIISRQATDLTFRRPIEVGEGSMTIAMNGGGVYTAKGEAPGEDAYVWVNRLSVTGAGQIGYSKTDRFVAYILDIPEIPGTDNVYRPQAARKTFVELVAQDGDSNIIYAELTHVVVKVDGQNRTDTPTLTLDRIFGGGVVDIVINAPRELGRKGNGELDKIHSITLPGTRNNIVLIGGNLPSEGSSYEILDKNGDPTGYYVTSKGLVTLSAGGSVGIGDFEVIVGDPDDPNDPSSKYRYFSLPNGAMLVLERATGRIISITQPGDIQTGEGEEAHDLGGIEFGTDDAGRLTIKITTNTSVDYSKLITVGEDGSVRMRIGEGGGSIYIEQAEDLSWTLPNGISIYFNQTFLLDGTVVQGTVIGTAANGNSLLVLEDMSDTTRTRFHVVEIKTIEGKPTFVTGHIYTRAEIASAIKASRTSVNMTIAEAENALSGFMAGLAVPEPFGTSSAVKALVDSLADELAALLTSNYKVKVTVELITETGTTGSGDDEIPVYSITSVSLKMAVVEVVEGGETPESLEASKTFGKDQGYDEENIGDGTGWGNATSDEKIGTKDATEVDGAYNIGKVEGINIHKNVAITGTPGDDTIKIQNGAQVFDLVLMETEEGIIYRVKTESFEPGSTPRKSRYEELEGIFFRFTETPDSTPGNRKYELDAFKLDQTGSGESNVEGAFSLNGGYYSVSGGYIFIDKQTDIAHGAKGHILYLRDSAVAVLADGRVAPIAIEGNALGDGGVGNATVTVAPEMVQMTDTYGNLVYSKISGYDIFGKPIYDTSSLPVYVLQRHKPGEDGKYWYNVYPSFFGSGEPQERELLHSDVYMLTMLGFNRVEPIYEYMAGTTIVRPVSSEGSNGAIVSYLDPTDDFDIPVDKSGYGIISQYIRVALGNSPGNFQAGTILFLNEQGKITSFYTPDGTYRIYEQGSYSGAAKEIYSEYNTELDGGTLTLSPGAATRMHELMTGIYILPFDDTGGSNIYFDSAFYGYDDKGQLVELEKVSGRYSCTNEGDEWLDGAEMISIYESGETEWPLIRILEHSDGRLVFLMSDGTWIDQNGDSGFVPQPSDRTLKGHNGDVKIELNSVSGNEVLLSIAGNPTGGTVVVTDNNLSAVNIEADRLVIAPAAAVELFSKDNRMKIKPKTAQTLELALGQSGVDYNGRAFIEVLEGNVILLESRIGKNSLADLKLNEGGLTITGLEVSGTFIADVAGSILMKDAGSMFTVTADAGDDTILSAGGDIGSPGLYFRVDIPEDKKLSVGTVKNLYVLGAVNAGTASGRDKNGENIKDASYLGPLGSESLALALAQQTAADIAAKIATGGYMTGNLSAATLLAMLAIFDGPGSKAALGITQTEIDAYAQSYAEQKMATEGIDELDLEELADKASSLGITLTGEEDEETLIELISQSYVEEGISSLEALLAEPAVLTAEQLAFLYTLSPLAEDERLAALLTGAIEGQDGRFISESDLSYIYY